MDEGKSIKISLSTFLLIINLIVICIMGYFIYNLNREKLNLTEKATVQNSNSSELANQNKIDQSENIANTSENTITASENIANTSKNTNQQNSTKVVSYADLKGIYTYSKKLNNDETSFYNLCLFENGTFNYTFGIYHEQGFVGNYIIVDNKIQMNKLFSSGSDVSLTATNGTLTLTINEDGSLTDTNEVIQTELDSKYKSVLSSINLKKSSAENDIKTYNNSDVNHLINEYALSNSYAE